jgi:glycosyltransferase involved in cell wall biosynthesis
VRTHFSELIQRPTTLLKRLRRQAVVGAWAIRALAHVRRGHFHDAIELLARSEPLASGMSNRVSQAVLNYADAQAARHKIRWHDAWKGSQASNRIRSRFAVESQRRFFHANVIVVKPFVAPRERGIVVVKYSEVGEAFPVLMDMERVQARYHVVLEPSTTGHRQAFVRLIDPRASVVGIQILTPSDADAFRKRGFLDLPLCAGDWVDESAFHPTPRVEKRFDFVMVSNFLPMKRHAFVFAALRRYWNGPLRFALAGASDVGGGERWIRELLEQYGLSTNAELHVDVAPEQINALLNASYCHILAALREGANRATFEAMLAGTPVLVPHDHVGFPTWRFPQGAVRTFAGSRDLVRAIRDCRVTTDPTSVVEMAKASTGSENATRILSTAMRAEADRRGESWTTEPFRHVNRVHASYFFRADLDACHSDYRYLQSCARDGFGYDPAVAQSLLWRR